MPIGADQQQEVGGVELNRGHDAMVEHIAPVRMRQDCGDRIREEGQRHHQEDFFDALVGAACDDEPDAGRRQRHGNVLGDAEEFARGGHAGKLGDGDECVGHEERRHGEGRATDAETLADQIGEALAGGRAHTRAHLLHDGQRDCDDNERP